MKTFITYLTGPLFVVLFSSPLFAQQSLQIYCRGNLGGAGAIIQGVRHESDPNYFSNTHITFQGTVSSPRFGTGRVMYEDWSNLAPYEGVLQLGGGSLRISIIEEVGRSSARVTIRDSTREAFRAPPVIGEFMCGWR